MNRRRQRLSGTRLHRREHKGIGVRVRAPRPPQVNRLAHRLWDRDKPVIGTPVAVLAFDFFALQPATPRGIHDSEDIAGVASPSQTEEFARPQGAETGNQKDGAVTDAVETGQQLGVHLDGKNRLVGFLDLGNDGLARDISLQDLLVHGLRQGRF